MQIQGSDLTAHLQQGLKPIYMVFSDDPFLLNQALDAVRSAAKQAGYDERQRFTQDKNFAWDQLLAAGQVLSLFTTKQLIELELPDGKPGRDGGQALQTFAEQQSEEQCLLLFGPRLRKDQQKAKWFQSLHEIGVFIPLYTPDKRQLPSFIQQRAQVHGVTLQKDAIALLSDWFEGNLLALDQALARAALINNSKPLDAEFIRSTNEDNSRFDIFGLRDALLANDYSQYLHCLERLLETGTEPSLMYWTLQKLHLAIAAIQQAQKTNEPMHAFWQREQIWPSQQQGFLTHARKQNKASMLAQSQLLDRIERAIKRDSGERIATLASHFGFIFIYPERLESLREFTAGINPEVGRYAE